MYNRLLKLQQNSTSSILLLGPRGTGKTMWAKHTFNDAIYVDLLDFSYYRILSKSPDELEKYIPKNFTGWIIIDEVQRIPELLNEVHRLIESFHYKFLLTGSSARSLRRKGVNLLAGRALRYNMHPLTIQELGNDFDLSKVLCYGLLPAVIQHENPEKYLTTYVESYLREEILQEGLTRNIGVFTHFLEAASFSQGNIINFSEIAREIGVSRQIVTDYFTILEDLLIAYRLSPFIRRAKRRMVVHAKFYFFDVGVYRAIRPRGPIDSNSEIDGPGLETLFLQSFFAINDYYQLNHKIYFWRTSNGQEVDFIIYGRKGLFAIEVKHTKTISNKNLNGLISFKKDYPEAKLYLLYLGKIRQYFDEIIAIPMEIALQELPQLLGYTA
jgi:uncharacterized protein